MRSLFHVVFHFQMTRNQSHICSSIWHFDESRPHPVPQWMTAVPCRLQGK